MPVLHLKLLYGEVGFSLVNNVWGDILSGTLYIMTLVSLAAWITG